MQIGDKEHKAQYFQDLFKQIRENIYFGEFQIWTIQQAVDKLVEEKKEIEAKLERKEFPNANEGRKAVRRINEGIQQLLLKRAELEGQNETLETRIVDLDKYVKDLA